MTAGDSAEAEAPSPRSKWPLLFGLLLALALGGGGFYVAHSGLLPWKAGAQPRSPAAAAVPDVAGSEVMEARTGAPEFVPLDPMVVMLGPAAGGRHLRFRAELEVAPGSAAAVARLMPRILDVLNGYLRAVPPAELEAPAALVRLRAQLLRRIQIVAGPADVRDLLVTEFVLN
jgi:flagellar FliL protein